MHYVIIAAGEGSRLQQEGVAVPKPLVNLDGRPMIGRLIDIFMANSPRSLSVIVNESMTEVRQYLQGLAPTLPCPVRLTVKSTPSSMHSLFEATREIDGKFIATTVDTIFHADEFAGYADTFRRCTDDGCMGLTGFIDDEKPLYADVDSSTGLITAYRDTPSGNDTYVSGGIYGLTPPAIAILRDCMAKGV